MKHNTLLVIFMLLITSAIGQNEKYDASKDTLLLKNLAEWQDKKFGLFMHWGSSSQWAVEASWTLCPEDADWIIRKPEHGKTYFEYKTNYENLQTTFNPVNFNPDKWAQAAKNAGMKYMIFTTKHHDGFCMFDTKQTDYKITSAKTPFSSNPKANITKELFAAFRKDGFSVGAYFSKPDWHSEDFWWSYFPPITKNVNYDTKKYPERWKAFQNFTYKQVEEIMKDYGKVDILWFDGGWVEPNNHAQDLKMDSIAHMARTYQPGVMIVDRGGDKNNENYSTPEQYVPKEPLNYPWETCMTMGESWGYAVNEKFKSSLTLVQTLIKIVSRGGNFLLNVGPSPNGDWDPIVYERLEDIGKWMAINSEAIYYSKPVAPYSVDNIFYTKSKDGKIKYAFYLSDKDEVSLPQKVVLKNVNTTAGNKITLLGAPQKLSWKMVDGNTEITIPATVAASNKSKYAATFKIETK